MLGTWWGLPVIGLAFLLSVLREKMLLGLAGSVAISFLPVSLPVCIYSSGVALLFAGARVWRKAWFPLGLLLLSQPVPILSSELIDIPLQNLSARVARGFTSGRIGFLVLGPQMYELAGSQAHVVSIMVRIDKLHSMTRKTSNYDLLSAEAQRFIAGLNLLSLSRDFQ
jgi:hypothetical protein